MHSHYSQSDLDAAEKRYRQLPRIQQMRIVQEIVGTRAHELRCAHANVVRVGAGVRRRRDAADRNRPHRDAPLCIVFMVSRKWPRSRTSGLGGIPSYLLAHSADPRGRAALFAVPTDVDTMADVRRARAQRSFVARLDGNGSSSSGCVSSVVVQSNHPSGNYGISCRHVLGFGDYAQKPWGTVGEAGAAQSFGQVSTFRGVAKGAGVMDSQLFRIKANIPLGFFPHFQGSTAGAAAVPMSMRLMAASFGGAGRPVTFLRQWQPPADADDDPDNWMFTGELLAVLVNGAPPKDGDSGSPLLAGTAHPTLVGMHIGISPLEGGNGCISWCIPAWRLLNPLNYERTSAATRWTLA